MPRTLKPPHILFDFVAGVTGAIRTVACGLVLLAREHSLAKTAEAKSGLFRQRRAELRALYLAPQHEAGTGSEENEPVRDPASKG